jgi:hypothetical protein
MPDAGPVAGGGPPGLAGARRCLGRYDLRAATKREVATSAAEGFDWERVAESSMSHGGLTQNLPRRFASYSEAVLVHSPRNGSSRFQSFLSDKGARGVWEVSLGGPSSSHLPSHGADSQKARRC